MAEKSQTFPNPNCLLCGTSKTLTDFGDKRVNLDGLS